ncbi:branched chain amino acid ABC transporter-like protein with ATP-binding domain protein [Paenibacillus larvae subsp. larvae]|uniref:Branched chain amino acid ABC transporter-like protein with ATP-binding domain n=2 Tax=Paenibacillus larvae subsp. larvae TaxID=147375 RepID=V9W1E7_9BACL|nr:branched chain amino acid ABC transporter-like protein with ATP-binding domain [Paenibacillus larvae subsp. larvae DSM 25430]AVF21434.1 branched chain amino acid ABC transporter-like protein with ATP-binding domain protein [Paenibacillus larvae subsp. larvae]ETK30224.1 branched chain amino acid ABC transporter-like protein with ATP-binding domain [Paenibacillus larvae subsp. larvae DSM 25719]PCK69192.1 branched chain amino acid ABC transporter-like protein with ATP-binding domain [Paenibacill
MLKLKGIRKVFNRRTVNVKVALNEIDLKLRPGDFVTIIGSNGAGKSTLMNIISGGMAPDHGTIEIDSEMVTGLSEYAVLSFYRTRTKDRARIPRHDGLEQRR